MSVMARHADRAYVRAVYSLVRAPLFIQSELKDDPELDHLFMGREMNDRDQETNAELSRRQWFQNIQDGKTQNTESGFRPMLAALGTVVAIHRPKEASEWDRMFRQRIDAWADYDRSRTETVLRGHGRRPRPRR